MDLAKIRKKAQREKTKKEGMDRTWTADKGGQEIPPLVQNAARSLTEQEPVARPDPPAETQPYESVPAAADRTSAPPQDDLARHHDEAPEVTVPSHLLSPDTQDVAGPGPMPAPDGIAAESEALVSLGASGNKEFLELASEELYKQSYVKEGEGDKLKLLCFKLSSEEYAIPITGVKEIIRPRIITEVPRVPEYVLGIISLRGVIVPVFDLRKRLGLPVMEMMRSTRIVIASDDIKTLGMVVDEVTQVMRVPVGSLEPPPPVIGGIEGEFVQGVGRGHQKMVILLNLRRILDMDIALEMRP